jgi:hypothetical protein
MTISDAGILELELEKVQSLLTKAEHSLQEDGVIPSSSEIESRINKLCKQLPALKPEDAKRLADQLPHLIKSLDKLAVIIRERKTDANSTDKTLITKASKAYQSASKYKRRF